MPARTPDLGETVETEHHDPGAMAETELYGQFALGRRDVPSAAGFTEDVVGSWTLRHHPSLPVRRIVGDGAGDTAVGWLLGHAFDDTARCAVSPLPLRIGNAESAEAIADAHHGRFLVVLVGSGAPQLVLDAMGSLAVVYDPARKLVGSTTTVLDPRTSARERELPPFRFHPCGLTGDPALRRLTPLHTLDLESWCSVLRSPKRLMRYADLDFETRVTRIADGVQRSLANIAESAPLYIALTAGYDSRLLLACAQPVWDRVELVTFDYPESRRNRVTRSERLDLIMARKIATSLGLRHHVLPIEPVSEADRERYLFRIGYAGNSGKSSDFDQACRRYLDLDRALITGLASDLGRAVYWPRAIRTQQLGRSPDDLIKLLRFVANDELRSVVSDWSAELSEVPLDTLYDLLFFDQRNGCWAMPHLYGFAPFAMTPLPVCSRELVDLLISAPLSQKLSNRLSRGVIHRACEPLDAIPYKGFGFATRWRHRLARRWRRVRRPLQR